MQPCSKSRRTSWDVHNWPSSDCKRTRFSQALQMISTTHHSKWIFRKTTVTNWSRSCRGSWRKRSNWTINKVKSWRSWGLQTSSQSTSSTPIWSNIPWICKANWNLWKIKIRLRKRLYRPKSVLPARNVHGTSPTLRRVDGGPNSSPWASSTTSRRWSLRTSRRKSRT